MFHGLRAFCIMWIVLGHSYLTKVEIPANADYIQIVEQEAYFNLIASA